MEKCGQCGQGGGTLRRCTGCLSAPLSYSSVYSSVVGPLLLPGLSEAALAHTQAALQAAGQGQGQGQREGGKNFGRLKDVPSVRADLSKMLLSTDKADDGSAGSREDDNSRDENRGADRAAAPGSETDSEQLAVCQTCKAKAIAKRCGRCHAVTYCSRDCQRADWATHKVSCRRAESATASGVNLSEQGEGSARRTRAASVTDLFALLFGLNPTRAPQPVRSWGEARARAVGWFPSDRVVDRLDQLDTDFIPFFGFAMETTVFVGRLIGPHPHPFRLSRYVEDIAGNSVYVIFYCDALPTQYFSANLFQEGNFICMRGAFLHMFMDGSVGFRVENPFGVRIIAASP